MIEIMINDVAYSSCFEKITWSGDYETAYRTLEVDYLTGQIPLVEAGDMVNLFVDNKHIFKGRVFSTSTSARRNEVGTFTCFDSAIYLVKNTTVANYRKEAPSNIAKRVIAMLNGMCEEGTFPEDNCVATITALGWNYEKIIRTAYAYQSNSNPNQTLYSIVDLVGKIHIVPTGILVRHVLSSQTNIRNAVYGSSIENMINQINIYKNDEDNDEASSLASLKIAKENQYSKERYGTFSECWEYTGDNMADIIQRTKTALRGAPDKTANITCSGNVELMSGYSVGVDIVNWKQISTNKDAVRQTGIFYIKSDTHIWTHNDYVCDLDLSYDELQPSESFYDIINANDKRSKKEAETIVKADWKQFSNDVKELKEQEDSRENEETTWSDFGGSK